MMTEAEFYSDSAGYSEVADALRRIASEDQRHVRHIQNKIKLLRGMDLQDAARSGLVKRPTGYIYVLRVKGTGGFGFRLPFFVVNRSGGAVIVFTHCKKRRDLNDEGYAAMVAEAEARRRDWIDRHN